MPVPAYSTPRRSTSIAGRLTAQGVFAANLFGRRAASRPASPALTSFDGRSFVFPSLDSGNAIALAVDGEPVAVGLKELRNRAAALKAETGLDLAPTITRLQLAKSLPGETLRL